MIRRSDIREQLDGYRYDSFDVAPPGTYGHPDVDAGPRPPNEGWLDRAREALSFGSNNRFEILARRVDRLFHW
jgi:hypothetical protein